MADLCRCGKWIALAALLAAAVFLPGRSNPFAGPLLLSGMDRPFGPGSPGLAGGQVALATGADAAWINPAGLVGKAHSELFLDAGSLEFREVTNDGSSNTTLTARPGGAAWVTGPSRTRPNFAYALVVHVPTSQSSSIQLDEQRIIGASDLPASVAGGLDYAALFPGGIGREESGTASGNLTVFSPGFAIGWKVADGFRIGALLRMERVSLQARESFHQSYSAQDDSTTTNVLTGSTLSAADYAGEANRFLFSVGMQVAFGARFTVGAVWKQPTVTLGGAGSVQLNRSHELEVSQDGTVILQDSASIHIRNRDAAFDLRSPGSLRLGLGFVFESMALGIDLEQVQALPRYSVFPGQESGASSSAAYRLAALEHQRSAVTRYAVSAAMDFGNQGSWLVGFATDPSPVPANDPLFRKLDLYHFTTAYYATEAAFSFSISAAYSFGESAQLGIPHLADSDSVARSVRFSGWSIGASGSYVF